MKQHILMARILFKSWRVIFPILKPTTVTVIILTGIRIWNDYLLPSLVVNQEGMYICLYKCIISLVSTRFNGN